MESQYKDGREVKQRADTVKLSELTRDGLHLSGYLIINARDNPLKFIFQFVMRVMRAITHPRFIVAFPFLSF